MKTHYYNDSDPAICQWVRNLIAAGLVPDGDVDERPIQDVKASEVSGYIQAHFFCGILGWPYALQLAGWEPTRPCWSGSCPCQPYSAAGSRKAREDDRDLWPHFYRLIAQVEPVTVFGEQVSSAIGHGWLDRILTDLEREDYATGAAVLGAHSAGAEATTEIVDESSGEVVHRGRARIGPPHIRQRLYWMAHAQKLGQRPGRDGKPSDGRHEARGEPSRHGQTGPVGNATSDGQRVGRRSKQRQLDQPDDGTLRRGMGVAQGKRREQPANENNGPAERPGSGRHAPDSGQHSGGGMADTDGREPGDRGLQPGGEHGQQPEDDRARGVADTDGGGRVESQIPVRQPRQDEAEIIQRGFANWLSFEFIQFADGKARRIEPGVAPLAHGVPGRVGRLRGYGNAICPQTAAEFIIAAKEVIGG